MRPALGIFTAMSIMSDHVSGGVWTRSLRYHSSCVLEFAGAP